MPESASTGTDQASGPGSAPAPPRGWRVATTGGTPVRVNVTVPLTTLLGGPEPGDLDGYGPITAAQARALATDATWRRLITDPLSGTVLDVGRTTYRPPTDLARLVRARDRTCTRPGCNTRATACELDHTIPFAHGGTTSLDNLGTDCRPDHREKTLGHFRVTQHPGGTFDWTSPTGHTYRRQTDGTTTHLGRGAPTPPPARRDERPHDGPRTDDHGHGPGHGHGHDAPEDPVTPSDIRDHTGDHSGAQPGGSGPAPTDPPAQPTDPYDKEPPF